jgi:hypothetical protein
MQMYCTFVLFVNQHFPGLPANETHCIKTIIQILYSSSYFNLCFNQILYYCVSYMIMSYCIFTTKKKKLHGLSPRANYTDRATAACRRSDCQLLRIERVPRGQRDRSLRPYSRFSRQEPLLFYQVAPQLYSRD